MSRALLAALPLLWLSACVTVSDHPVDDKAAAKANVDLGVAYLKQGNLQIAKDKLERAQKEDPKSPEVYWAMASLYETMDQPKDAARNYEKALDLSPGNSQIENTYAVFLCRQGDVDRALPLFEKVIADRLYPTPYAAAANAGMCLRDDKRNADARRYFERAIALSPPNFVDAVVGLADLQLEQGDAAGAATTVKNYMAGGSKSAEVLVVGVRAATAQHDCGTAQIYARLVRRDFPNSPQAAALPQQLGACNGSSN